MWNEKTNVLVYAVRIHVVLKYCGQLALMLAIITLVPLGFVLSEADWLRCERYAILCTGLFLIGGLLSRLRKPAFIQSNEALTVTAIIFVLSPLLMSWPMMDVGIPYIDVLFEAVSAVTTTGLSTLGSIEGRPHTFLFARAWMQWYGGLGIIVLSVALLMGHHAAARRLTDPVDSGETLASTARIHGRRTLLVYGLLTLLGMALVWPLCGNGFTALLHVLAAVSTGGFSNYDTSLAGLSSRPAAVAAIPGVWQKLHENPANRPITSNPKQI